MANDQLGKSKNLFQGDPPVSQDHAFGVAPKDDGEWNAAMCITGAASEKELEPDHDLGKCVKQGARNVVRKPEDADRAFGAPTIRLDIPYKERKSVADHQNYGDEPDAVELLFPTGFTELGISEADFAQLRTREEIRSLFESIGFTYKIGKFNAIYNRGKLYCNSPDDRCSVRGFMHGVKELDPID